MLSRRSIMNTGAALGVLLAIHPTAALAQESRILNDLRKRGSVRIATSTGNPPYSTFKADGTPEGYDVDIARQFAAALNVKPEWVLVDLPGRMTALENRQVDVTISNFTATVGRSTTVAFTRPYLIVGSTFMVKNGSALQTMDQARKPETKIGVLVGSTHEEIFKRVTPTANMVPFRTTAEAFLALSANQIDAMILDSLQNAAFLAKDRANYRNLPGNWSYEEISIGVPTGDVDWLRIVDTFVRQLAGSGESARLFKKHFGYDMPPL